MSFPSPSEEQRCQGYSKRSQKPCPNYAMQGEAYCQAHHPDLSKRSLVGRDPSAAQARRNEKRRQKRIEAEEKGMERRLGLKAMTAARAERHREELIDKLFEHALSKDARISMAALTTIYDRVLGRPTQSQLNLNADLESNPIAAAFLEMSPEERRQLLQAAKDQPPQIPPGGDE
jgi:hypothetical protein